MPEGDGLPLSFSCSRFPPIRGENSCVIIINVRFDYMQCFPSGEKTDGIPWHPLTVLFEERTGHLEVASQSIMLTVEYKYYRRHRMNNMAMHRCGLLLQHIFRDVSVCGSVRLCVLDTSVSPTKRVSRSRCRLGCGLGWTQLNHY